MAIDPAAPRSRRAILAGAIGGAGALAAHALSQATPVSAANDAPVLLGQGTTATDNAATLATIVNSTVDAVGGVSAAGIALRGRTVGQGPAFPDPSHSTGVIGTSGDDTGIAVNTNETGVYGYSDESIFSAGVWGDTSQGIGVIGTGDWGVYGTGLTGVVGDVDALSNGVYGFSGDEPIIAPLASAGVLGTGGAGGGVGVRGHAAAGGAYGMIASAVSTSQYALYVSGKLRLSRSGRVSIASTATTKVVAMAGVTTGSFVVATIQTNVSGCYVRAVVPAAGSFTIYLSKAPGKTVAVGYVVVN